MASSDVSARVMSDIVALWEVVEPKAGKRGPYKKRISA